MLSGVIGKLKSKLVNVRRDAQNKKRIKDAQQRVDKKR